MMKPNKKSIFMISFAKPLIAFFLCGSCSPLLCDVYVSPSGADAPGHGTISKPFLTIGWGITEVGDGGTVYVQANGVYAGAGNVGISISKNVTITSYDTGAYPIISLQMSNVFLSSNTATVTLNNLDIINGLNIGGNGGAINNAGNLTINNCTFSGNLALYGGAIYTIGSMVLTNCTFSGNFAANGGATYSYWPNICDGYQLQL